MSFWSLRIPEDVCQLLNFCKHVLDACLLDAYLEAEANGMHSAPAVAQLATVVDPVQGLSRTGCASCLESRRFIFVSLYTFMILHTYKNKSLL